MNMRSLVFGCLLALAAVPAVAADMPARMATKAPAVVPAYDWSGFYVGGNVGYGFGRTTGTGNSVNYDIHGVIGGGQIGANYQIGAWVLGIEADYQWADVKGSGPLAPGFISNTSVERFGTVRGRLGYAWDRWMVYGTGGYAFSGRTAASFTPAFVNEERDTLSGWAAGLGLEYAFAPNWSAKLEYLHVDLGDQTYFASSIPPCGAAPATCTTGARFDTVRVGLNYRFLGGGARW